MPIRDLFVADITRDIPPVVYFHEQTPAKLAGEVSEYIITGGYPPGDPRARRVERGIHEEMTSLLRAVVQDMNQPGGPSLPASWISGFYGSGKSSFAKLLGLAIDGKCLPDGTPLWQALLARDDSPRAAELHQAWQAFQARFQQSIAIVFDIGATARDNQHVHHAVVHQLQARLGYCRREQSVADFELKLEKDGLYPEFLEVARQTLGRDWETAKEEALAEDHFSHILHKMDPERYRDPMTWVESRAGSRHSGDASPVECVQAIEAMLDARAEHKILFIVVDEVSQFVAQDDEKRMLRLQAFVESLGARLKGRAWLFATGQQKLEAESVVNNIGKLKDRFPPKLRVHLATTNIRDVVHKRLLKKRADREKTLRDLFQTHRADLKRHAYDCEQITEEDFVEVYPMLPGHVDLLLEITSALRASSSRVQGDDYAIRGLLQLLGELFRAEKLADREIGSLVTLDAIFNVQQTALDPDVQNTLARIFDHADAQVGPLHHRVAKAVALLELVQQRPGLATTPELVARCLYDRLGLGSQVDAIKTALDQLGALSLLSFTEKYGYKIQSSAGQEWARERDAIGATPTQRSEMIHKELSLLLADADRPRLRAIPFGWLVFFNDGRDFADMRLRDPRTDAAIAVDFRLATQREDRESTRWLEESKREGLADRLLWVNGDPGTVQDLAGQLVRSARMVHNHEGRVSTLPGEKQRLFFEEQRRVEETSKKLQEAIADAYLAGSLYFRGVATRPRDLASAFTDALTEGGNRTLPALFPHFSPIAISEKELDQLLPVTLSGPSSKFMDGEGGLGILVHDSGRYVARCDGVIPARIAQHIAESNGLSGMTLLQHFARPPYGHPADVVRACILGLLRGRKIRIEPEQGKAITSIQDEGAVDLFRKLGDFRKATILPPNDGPIPPRAPVAIAKFFTASLQRPTDPEYDAIATAVFDSFGPVRERLRVIEGRLQRLPGRPELIVPLRQLEKALEAGRKSRQVEDIVLATYRHLDALRDGVQQLGIHETELTEAAILAVNKVAAVRDVELLQLKHAGELGHLAAQAEELEKSLKNARPWRELPTLQPAADAIQTRYREVRGDIVLHQSRVAEAHRSTIKTNPSFGKLTDDQRNAVLRPIAEATPAGDREATTPTLVELRDGTTTRLAKALEVAIDRLDELSSTGPGTGPAPRPPVVRVEARLAGVEISSPEQLDRALAELRERVLEQLKGGARVRLQ
jgi:hypothetical protein